MPKIPEKEWKTDDNAIMALTVRSIAFLGACIRKAGVQGAESMQSSQVIAQAREYEAYLLQTVQED